MNTHCRTELILPPDSTDVEPASAVPEREGMERYTHLLEMLADPLSFSHCQALEWAKRLRHEPVVEM